jgi:hypothetical protein
MKEQMLQYLNSRISDIEKSLAIECEERGIDYYESTHYDLSCEDGEPYSSGNSTDCYSDGHERGCEDGELDTLKVVKKYVESL